MGALCLYLWMALLTYDRADPGWSHASNVEQVHNLGGRAGAWFADILFMALGYFAYLFPLLLAIKTTQAFKARHDPWRWNGWLFSWRLAGLVLLLISGSALAFIHFQSPSELPASPGGALGGILGHLGMSLLNVHGSTLVFLALFVFGLTVFTDLSWFGLMDLTGKITLDLFDLVRNAIVRWWSARVERRRLVAQLREVDAPVKQVDAPVRQKEEAAPPRKEKGIALPKIALPTVAVPRAEARIEPRIEPWIDAPLDEEPVDAVEPVAPKPQPASQVQVTKAVPEIRPVSAPVEEPVSHEPLFVDRDEIPLGDETALEADEKVDETLPWADEVPFPVDEKPLQAPVPVRETYSPAVSPRPAVEVADEPERRSVPVITPLSESIAPRPVTPVQVVARPVPTFVDSALAGTLPPLSLLDPAEKKSQDYSSEALANLSRLLEIKLKEFGVEVTVESVHPGPVITRFEIQPAPGIKVSRISNLAKDLARSMAMISVRVVEVIPGKTTVGIEVPNEDRQMVHFSEVLSSPEYEEAKSPVTLALGHDIGGKPVIADLAKMPHLLVAGTTGSGKSVGVNAMILSILFKSTPEEARLIMIDPKMLELSIYEGIPHLLCPVVTDMKEAANALRWSVAEMERRYKLMAAMGVRNLAGFNRKIKEAEEAGMPLGDPLYRRESMDDEPPLLRPLPTIVVVVDEFADMMMIVGKKVEELIARIAQKARAAGIHLILATQRPSVDVITGLIKANIPTRMAFQVSSKIDSRTILDQGGAEQLLGHGDMLYLPPGTGLPIRVHGAFVSDDEVHRVVEAWKQRGAPDYIEDILSGVEEGGSGFEGGGSGEGGEGSEEDPLYDEAVRFVTESRRASISAVQRKLKIGYNRAARMIEAMEMAGVVSSMNTNGSREVIAPAPVRD